MTKGRKKIPNALKKAKGTNQPSRMDPSMEVKQKIDSIPRVPGWVPLYGKKIYKSVTAYLESVGILSADNLPMILAYANELGKYLQYEKDSKGKRVLEKTDGQGNKIPYPNPLNKMANDALMNAMKIGQEFGITPQAQSRILALLKTAKDVNDEFFD
jgi:P27 family predicted phage terminase small subunit